MADNPYAAPSSNVTGGDSYGSANDIASSTVNILRMTKGWARFLSVLGYIAGGILIVIVLIGLANLDEFARQFGRGLGGYGRGVRQAAMVALVVYMVVAVVVCIIPAIILGSYASRIGGLIANPGTVTLDTALDQQRKFYKYIGILAIIYIGLLIILFLLAISQR